MSEAASDAGHSIDRGPPAEEAICDLNADTAETVPLIVFKYNQNTEKALTDHFKREKITKPIDGEIVLERSNTADVLLNERVFGRKHAVLFCRQSQNGCVAVMLQNKHEKKKIFVIRGKQKTIIGPGDETELFSNDEIHLELLMFIVEIQEGDCEVKTFEFQLKSYVEHTFPGSSVKQNPHPVPGNTPSTPYIVYQQQMVFPEISSQNIPQTIPLMSSLNTNVSGPFTNLQNVSPPGLICNDTVQPTAYAAVQSIPYAPGQPITYAHVQPITYANIQSNDYTRVQSTPNVPVQSNPYTYPERQVESSPRAVCPSVRHSYNGSIIAQPTTDDTAPGFLPNPPQGSAFPQSIEVRPNAVGPELINTDTDIPNTHIGSIVYQPVTYNFVTTHTLEESSQSQGQNNQAEGRCHNRQVQGQNIQGQDIGGQDQSLPGMEFHFHERRGGTVPNIGFPDYYANMNSVSLGGVNGYVE